VENKQINKTPALSMVTGIFTTRFKFVNGTSKFHGIGIYTHEYQLAVNIKIL